MSVPISSFASNQVQTGRLTPVGRTTAAGARAREPERDAETIHLSDAARAILAGTLPPSEVTVFPARVPPEDLAADNVQDAEFEPVLDPWGAGPASEDAEAARSTGGKVRTPEQERAIQQLQARDTEVRAHEAAHSAAAGSLGGRPSLEYVMGPDGRRYAVSGEVSVDTSPGRTPEETISRARTIRAAATAPASPSAQDMAVAAAATRMESEAQAAIRERHQAETRVSAERVSAEDVDPDTVRPFAWSRVGEAKGTVAANDVKPPAAASAAPSAHPSAEALAVPDPDMVMLQLVREQVSARGGMGHNHLSSGCGFCRRAAATYAYA